jgi:hypothetical protein
VGLVVVRVHVLVVVAPQPHRLGALEQLHPARPPPPATVSPRARPRGQGRPTAAAAVVLRRPRGSGILGHATGARGFRSFTFIWHTHGRTSLTRDHPPSSSVRSRLRLRLAAVASSTSHTTCGTCYSIVTHRFTIFLPCS